MTSLQACLPPKEHTFTREERTERLKNPAVRQEIKQSLLAGEGVKFSSLKSLDDVLLIDCPVTVQYRGKTVAQVAREQGIDPYILSTEACAVCDRCAIMDGLPCRMPGRMHPCVESHGIVLTKTLEENGLDFQYGSNMVTWYSLLFYND